MCAGAVVEGTGPERDGASDGYGDRAGDGPCESPDRVATGAGSAVDTWGRWEGGGAVGAEPCIEEDLRGAVVRRAAGARGGVNDACDQEHGHRQADPRDWRIEGKAQGGARGGGDAHARQDGGGDDDGTGHGDGVAVFEGVRGAADGGEVGVCVVVAMAGDVAEVGPALRRLRGVHGAWGPVGVRAAWAGVAESA